MHGVTREVNGVVSLLLNLIHNVESAWAITVLQKFIKMVLHFADLVSLRLVVRAYQLFLVLI